VGLRAVLKTIVDTLELDAVQLGNEINLIHTWLDVDVSRSMSSALPNIPVLSFASPRNAAKLHPDAQGIVDALFHGSRAIAFTAARLIEDQAYGFLGLLVDSRLQDAPDESLRFVSHLAHHIWGSDSTRRLSEELDRGPRPGISHFAKRLIELPNKSADAVFYEQVLTLIRQDDVYEASAFAAILARFDAALHDLRRLRELFEYWLEHQPPFRNGETSYESPVASIGALILQRTASLDEYRVRIEKSDRSEIRELLSNSAHTP